MKTNVFLILALFALLFGCTKDAVPEEVPDEQLTLAVGTYDNGIEARGDNPHLNGKAVERHIKFERASGAFNIEMNSDMCPPNPYFPGYRYNYVLIEGDGIGSHVGKFTVVNDYCINFFGYPVTPTTGTITAANGDEVFELLLGRYQEDGQEVLPYLIYGGTGRFEGASGGFTLYGHIDDTNGVYELEGEGTITY